MAKLEYIFSYHVLHFTFEHTRIIAENICHEINYLIPSITTTEVTVADRAGKLYLDPNQNDYADTVAVVYSVRPFKRPNVSTPIDWKELTLRLSPENFTMDKITDRLKKKGDLFLQVLDKKIASKNDKLLRTLL